MTVGSVSVLVGAITAANDTVRQRVVGLFTNGASAELAAANGHMQRGLTMANDFIGYEGSHISPGMFLIGAGVLVVGMLTLMRK